MNVCNYQVRRATVDDLAALRRLWQKARLPGSDLEKRLTEFQVAETPAGEVLGALGLLIDGGQAKLHSEAYEDPELAAELRPRLWERIQALARNHGLARLWVENGSMFCLEQDFEVAGQELLRKLPPAFGPREGSHWLTLALRPEGESTVAIEQELLLFRQAQEQERERITQRARLLKILAGTVAAVVLLLAAFLAYYVLGHLKGPLGR